LTTPVSYRLTVNLLGSAFELDTDDAATFADVQRLWQPFIPTGAAGAEPAGGAAPVAVRLDEVTAPERLQRFATAVNAAALDAAPHFAVHAGVVAHDGVAVAMPAVSGTGKSTMTAACLRRGFRYVSDEALCLSYTDGTVLPYPRPIALSPWSVAAVRAALQGTPAADEYLFTAEDLGSARHDAPARLGHLVVLDRREGVAPALSPEPRPNGITLLLQLSFNHYRRPDDAVRLAAQVVANASVWTLQYSEPLQAADLLWNSLVGERAQP
jgi:hypothetical protein